jgi:hypothetical protein
MEEASLAAPAFPFRRLVLPPLALLGPYAVLAVLALTGFQINIHGLSGMAFALSFFACFIAFTYLEVTGCAQAAVLLNVWPELRTARNWFALAFGVLSLLAAAALTLAAISGARAFFMVASQLVSARESAA